MILEYFKNLVWAVSNHLKWDDERCGRKETSDFKNSWICAVSPLIPPDSGRVSGKTAFFPKSRYPLNIKLPQNFDLVEGKQNCK
jgi:hypothetical protein